MPASGPLDAFVRQKTVLLTTYKRDGSPVGTPVHLAVDGNRAYFRTYDASWKAKRLRRNAHVEVAPSTVRGKPTGSQLGGEARLLDGDEAATAAHALAGKYRFLHGFLIPRAHRLKGWKTLHYEFIPDHTGRGPRDGRVDRLGRAQ